MSRRALVLFLTTSVLWGIPYAFIKAAVEELEPATLAFLRVAIGALVLLPFALRRGAFAGLRGRVGPLLLFALLEFALAWPLIGLGETRISSSLTGILLAAVPLIMAVVVLRVDPEERPTRVRLAGLLLGLAGVVALLGLDVAGRPGELLGALAVLGTATCYALAPLVAKGRLADLDQVGVATAALAAAAVMLLPFAAAAPPPLDVSGRTVAAVLVLALLCSALAMVVYLALLGEIGPARASIITYVIPVVATGVGVLALDERLGTFALVGLGLILAGSWLATRPTPAAPAGDAGDDAVGAMPDAAVAVAGGLAPAAAEQPR